MGEGLQARIASEWILDIPGDPLAGASCLYWDIKMLHSVGRKD
jgi:hypothetical protein